MERPRPQSGDGAQGTRGGTRRPAREGTGDHTLWLMPSSVLPLQSTTSQL